jgi:hypothetical protein
LQQSEKEAAFIILLNSLKLIPKVLVNFEALSCFLILNQNLHVFIAIVLFIPSDIARLLKKQYQMLYFFC